MSRPGRRQQGIALLAFVSIFTLGASYLLVSRLNALTTDYTAVNRTTNAAVLRQAKQALIGYVALQASKAGEDNPGKFPCPEPAAYAGDTNATPEGTTSGTCGLPALGRLPWRTLGLQKLLDASGEPLWFALSPGWGYAGSQTNINSNSLGQLMINPGAVTSITQAGGIATVTMSAHGFKTGDEVKIAGASPTGYNVAARITSVDANTFTYAVSSTLSSPATGTIKAGRAVVALVIAPGPRMNAAASTYCSARDQSGRLAPSPSINAADYIECYDSANGIFSTTGPSGSFNDQVVTITSAEVLPALETAVADRFQKEVAPVMATVYNGGAWPSSTVLPFAEVLVNSTISVTNGSPIATLPAPRTPSLQGHYLRVASSTTPYLVSVHPAGSAILTLSTAYSGATNATAALKAYGPQGKLPFTNAETTPGSGIACIYNATSAPDCDPSLVAWTGSPTLTRTGGASAIGSPVACTISTASQITHVGCTFYGYNWTWLPSTMNVRLAATASYAGMALRELRTAVSMTGIDAIGRSASAVLNADGSASVTLTGTASAAVTYTDLVEKTLHCGLTGFLAPFQYCYRYTVSVPILLLADHSLLDSNGWTYGWFARNKWHQAAYYAVASGIVPSGVRSCTSGSTCLMITDRPIADANDSKRRALLVLAGRPYATQSRPALVAGDLIESAESSTSFSVRIPGAFNDRIAVISSNP